jgi:hypothetical protein
MDNTGTDLRSRHRRGAMAAAAAVVALGALAVIGWQEHWPSAVFGSATPQALTWSATQAPLPADAAVAKQYVYFNSATCPASGDCIAVGGYKAQNGSAQGLIETATFKRGL